MYRLGERGKDRKKRRKFWRIFWLLLVVLLVWAIIWVKDHLKPQTTIHQAKAVVTETKAPDSATKAYNEGDFSIKIPASWQLQPEQTRPYHIYTWQTTEGGTNLQQISVYEDRIPEHFAVNKVLIVESQGDRLTVNEPVSDSCQNFTRTGTGDYGQIGFLAKWQGVTFLCDANNTERDLVGTSSNDAVNRVALRSGQGVNHTFLFVYNDSTLTPNYQAFYAALNSFQMN
ncbi:MAG TPA: hypothetical protein VHB51_01025 [Candidatus Saccharimonadales bacterium]|nr:hypothetical protein [Candidatus Saccharimonadales bacterium]